MEVILYSYCTGGLLERRHCSAIMLPLDFGPMGGYCREGLLANTVVRWELIQGGEDIQR